ncbi:hypothetical protein GDO81_026624 [Engystomops pustulosus]|uniref:Taste receptor type 2 n=1 Tax=Engystomops pustulosus TaxID=76066 RepID=A0AAV6YGL0_ENGPU|nr:hypothetical protein GDO81_026624 [Engystomops pustulosus]
MSLTLFTYILDLISCLFLTPTSMFIFVINLLSWIKVKKLLPVDQLITSISVCNIVEQMMMFTTLLNIIYRNPMITMIYFALFSMVMSCNVWFSTFLCVYFCLKIVNVKNTLYICLQRNFQKILPWLFVSVILGSVLVSVPIILNITEGNLSNSGLNISAIYMQTNSVFIDNKEKDLLAFMILSWIAMLILSISASVIVTSLIKHMNQVQQNIGGFRSPNMKAHVQALRTVISFLFTNVFIFLVLTGNITSRDYNWNYLMFLIYYISKGVVSWSLIKGNRTLDKALRNIFSKLHCTNTSNNVG